ncbi:PqqA peptide cyclase [Myxococcaceae bacterium]|jgi:MoaA/NifB/PqqE/SkfB family radical SAM enzyme|nr:PqqA peptide cyclase [Myxococcaceae bacterium]
MNTRVMIETTWRRRHWLFRLSPGQIWNYLVGAFHLVLKRERVSSFPGVVKIDISPICNLSCTVCVHADPNGNDALERQRFAPGHKMTVEQFRKIIDQIAGKTATVSLYTWGDPMTHPDLDEMCRIAADAGLQVHVSTNFSFGFKEDRLRSIVESGLTHLTVCVDGLSQEKYQKTRVGGRIDRVLHNLRRVAELRKELGREYPKLEMQYIKYQHNLDEVEPARRLAAELGVEQFSDFWGALHNYADREPDQYETLRPKPNQLLPQCYWPHFSMVIKYNGDVIPCCEHRMAAQHMEGGDARVFGNAFETSVAEVWNNEEYQKARRIVSNPEVVNREPELRKHFCDGCFVIFDTEIQKNSRWANRHRWEEVFEMDERGRPRRKPKDVTGLPA